MSLRPLVGFCGSRGVSRRVSSSFVSSVVASVAASGRGVAVGCAVGADQLALSSRLLLPFPLSSSGPQLVVFAVGGSGGQGFCSSSALRSVQRASSLAVCPGHGSSVPVSVRWWAGGGRGVPLRHRLRARSRALVSAVAASGPGCGLVAFVRGGWSVSPGSWGTVRAAVLARVPVVVFSGGAFLSCVFPLSCSLVRSRSLGSRLSLSYWSILLVDLGSS